MRHKAYMEERSKIKELKMKKLRVIVAGPHRSGKTSFIQTFINYKFDFQKVKFKGNRQISKARKIINNVEFEIEFLESKGF